MPGTLTGKFMRIDGVTPAKGTVLIEANVPVIVDATGDTVFSGPLRIALVDGAFSVPLPAVRPRSWVGIAPISVPR